MKKKIKKFGLFVLYFVISVLIFAFILAYLPTDSTSTPPGISVEYAAELRQNFKSPHHTFLTSDGETLFLRRWNPDSAQTGKEDIAVLLFHGVTAHSGAYSMVGVPFSKYGYTTFGLDYRGHGLSGGNRGDSKSKERWIQDLTESVEYIKTLGFKRVIVMGHSLGVAAALYTGMQIPNEIAGIILLSGTYEARPGDGMKIPFGKKLKILASSIFRPSFQAVRYSREGMTGINDPLFTFRYSLRFLSMVDVYELKLPDSLNIPVLVGVGDKDEMFEVEKVKVLFNDIPGKKKEFMVLKNATHATFPEKSWDEIANWLIRNFPSE
jgi:alpha-beta hydrolase superfamily lysophospholipase